jgi:hypothetical protein
MWRKLLAASQKSACRSGNSRAISVREARLALMRVLFNEDAKVLSHLRKRRRQIEDKMLARLVVIGDAFTGKQAECNAKIDAQRRRYGASNPMIVKHRISG